MKKLWALVLLLLSIPLPAQASSEIRLVTTPTRLLDGTFRNDSLFKDLLPDGKFGKFVYTPSPGAHTWIMDPEFIDEIADMSDGYRLMNKEETQGAEVAKDFLARLQNVSASDVVIALPFGNPDRALANQLAPSELRFYTEVGKATLENHLRRAVSVAPGFSKGKSFASNPQKSQYTKARRAIARIMTVVPESELQAIRAQTAVLLSPKLNKSDRMYFYYHAGLAIEKLESKLRISPGKYQLTSEKSKMPITLVNDHNAPVTVNLQLVPINFRITVEGAENVTIPPKSRLQLSIPFTVRAPGPTTITAQLTNSKGVVVSPSSELAVKSTIIDSRVAWFTTAAGVLLLFAGIVQSLKRVRRAKHEGS